MISCLKECQGALSVLLVDDHCLVRAGIRELIRISSPHVEVHEAESAELAWNIIHEFPIDVAFLDLDLQGPVTGLDLLERLRADGVRTRFVMLSATADTETVAACLRAGASGYVPKATDDSDVLRAAVEFTIAGGIYLPGPYAV